MHYDLLKDINLKKNTIQVKKCCYFKSTGTWDFGLICVLAQPSYSDKIYDLTFFFSKSDRINLGSGLTLTAALSAVAPHTGLWIPSSFNTKSIPWVCQQHSSYFSFFFFLGEGWLCLILSMVASLEILKGNLSPRRQSLASPIPKHKSWKAIRSLFPQLYSMGIECICSKSTQTKVSKHLFVGENTVNTISEVLFWINCIFSFFLWCFLFPQPTEESSLTSTTTQGLCCYRCHQFRNRVALKLHFENPFHLNC